MWKDYRSEKREFGCIREQVVKIRNGKKSRGFSQRHQLEVREDRKCKYDTANERGALWVIYVEGSLHL